MIRNSILLLLTIAILLPGCLGDLDDDDAAVAAPDDGGDGGPGLGGFLVVGIVLGGSATLVLLALGIVAAVRASPLGDEARVRRMRARYLRGPRA